ncbi:MAG: hypothetical protein RLY86_3837, partial [Pseudomonadota bacterium]
MTGPQAAKPDLTRTLAAHAADLTPEALPPAAAEAARIFLLDTLAVGIAGARAPHADGVLAVARSWGGVGPTQATAPAAAPGMAPVLGRGIALPAPSAAYVNAFQIHAQEFDCVHEAAVVHPMATILSALMADVARLPVPVDGRRFLAALAAAVDVAAGLGLAARSPLKFFRPATAGIFGCVAGIANLRRLDEAALVAAFGHALSLAAGTMQAHVEGKPGLPLQIANAARNALTAVDLALAGVPGVTAALDGPYGYLPLFEDRFDTGPVLAALGSRFRIGEVSHKPFPTGRAAHGPIAAVQALMRDHGLTAATLDSLTYTAPPLIQRLVGRPARPDMAANYARLCFPWLGAVTLARGTVGLTDFDPASLADPALHRVAARIRVVADD